MDTTQDDRHTDWGWFYYRVVDDFGPVIKADGVAVYMVLVRHASNDARSSYPAIATIAQKLGISERQVRYILDRLAAVGLIAIEPRMERTANGKSRQTSNLYRLLPLPAAPPANIAPPATDAGDPLQILPPPPANIADELDSVNYTQKERESDAPATNGHISNGHSVSYDTTATQHKGARPLAEETPPPVTVKVPPGTPVNRRPDAPARQPRPRKAPIPANWQPPPEYATRAAAEYPELSAAQREAALQQFRHHYEANQEPYANWGAKYLEWLHHEVHTFARAPGKGAPPAGPAPPAYFTPDPFGGRRP